MAHHGQGLDDGFGRDAERFVVGLLFVMAAGPAIAGAGVGQSIWKQEQAYQRALQSKPADAKVTGSIEQTPEEQYEEFYAIEPKIKLVA